MELAYKYESNRLRPAAVPRLLADAMSFFDVFHQLSATRAWPLRAFFRCPGLFDSSFHPAPRATNNDISSSVSFMTAPMPTLYPAYIPPMPSQTPTTISPFMEMPLELICTVIEAACEGADDSTRVGILKSCSLVCRTWSNASQRLLFSKVTLRSQRAFEAFMFAVDRSAEHGASLGDAVQHLSVVLDHNQPSGLHQNSLALAVTACPNLSRMGISLYGCAEPGNDIIGAPDVSRLRRAAPSFDETTLSLLKSGPKIQYLHFDNWSENHNSIFQLLDIWPSLRFLSIGGTPPQHLQNSPPPFPCALRGVRFNFQTTPSVDFMRWLLFNSAESLETLHFERDPCADVLEYLIDAHGGHLRSISLPGYGSPLLMGMVTKVPHLRELRTENPSTLSAHHANLSDEVEHLAFGLDRNTPLGSIIDVIKTREKLQTVTVHVSANGDHHPLFCSLKIACMYRGIDYDITTDLRLFRATNTLVSFSLSNQYILH